MKKQVKNGIKVAVSAALAVSAVCGIPFSAYPNQSVYAAEDTVLKDLILQIKSKIFIPSECVSFDSSVSKDENGAEYNLYWSTPSEFAGERIICRVTVNSKGDILDYFKSVYSDKYSYDDAHFSAVDPDKAKTVAKEFLFKVNPNWQADFPDSEIECLKTDLNSDSICVRFKRMKNGLEFCGNVVNVMVDKITAEVTSMSSDYTYAEDDNIPNPDRAISVEEAKDKYFEVSLMKLQYIDAEGKGKLVYKPEIPYYKINAENGEEFSAFRYGYSDTDEKNDATTESGGGSSDGGALTEQELESVREYNNLLSSEELRKKAESIKGIGIEDAEYVSEMYYLAHNEFEATEEAVENDAENPKYVAQLSYAFTGKDKDGNSRRGEMIISLDAKNGKLEGFYSYGQNSYSDSDKEDNQNNIDEKTAKKTVDEFLKEYAADEFKDVKFDGSGKNAGSRGDRYYFDFIRYANDVVYPDNGIYVNVNKATGHITSYYKVWSDNMEFETVDGVIGEDAARIALEENSQVKLTYAKLQGKSRTVPEIGLRYEVDTPGSYLIGAKSGKHLDYKGAEYVEEEESSLPDDISGHYAEKQIIKLFEEGNLQLKDGEKDFRPDDYITVEEFSDMLKTVFRGSSPVKYIGNFNNTEAGNIKNEAVTREYAARAIVYLAGYERTALLKNIFSTGFYDEADINPELVGCVAVCKGLGIMNGDENNFFKPGDLLTRGDAAIIIYNYLAR